MKEFRKNKQDLFICQECKKPFLSCKSLTRHITQKHCNIKNYYDKYIKDENEGLCKECNHPTAFIGYKGYREYCSVKCMSNSSIIKHKIKHTCLEKYGDENYHNMEKTKQTNFKKYGCEYTFNNTDIKAKISQTILQKYGVNNVYKSDEIKAKIKHIKKEKHDDENYNNQIKVNQTCMQKYGVKHHLFSNEIREKIKQSFIQKYGVENPQQNQEIFERTQKSGFNIKNYKDTNIYYRGTYEEDFLERYFILFPDIINAKSIKYVFEEKIRIYFPDFYIPSLNLIIEIKNSYLFKKDKLKIEAKENAVITNNFKYFMIVDKNYLEFNKLFLK